jgi:general secretion pathway protein D
VVVRVSRSSVSSSPKGYTLNFRDADVRDVAKAVLGDILGLNYLVDPGAQGRITLETAAPVPRTAAPGILERSLASIGLSLIDAGGLLAIAPTDRTDAYRTGLVRQDEALPGVPAAGIQAIELRYVPARELQRLMAPFLEPDTRIEVDPLRNRLLVSAAARELPIVRDFVDLFDTDRFRDVAIELYRLQTGNAAAFSAHRRSARTSRSPRDSAARGIVFGADMLTTDRLPTSPAQPFQLTPARPFAPHTKLPSRSLILLTFCF